MQSVVDRNVVMRRMTVPTFTRTLWPTPHIAFSLSPSHVLQAARYSRKHTAPLNLQQMRNDKIIIIVGKYLQVSLFLNSETK